MSISGTYVIHLFQIRSLRKHLKCHFLQIELNNWFFAHMFHQSIKVSLIAVSVDQLIYLFLTRWCVLPFLTITLQRHPCPLGSQNYCNKDRCGWGSRERILGLKKRVFLDLQVFHWSDTGVSLEWYCENTCLSRFGIIMLYDSWSSYESKYDWSTLTKTSCFVEFSVTPNIEQNYNLIPLEYLQILLGIHVMSHHDSFIDFY